MISGRIIVTKLGNSTAIAVWDYSIYNDDEKDRRIDDLMEDAQERYPGCAIESVITR